MRNYFVLLFGVVCFSCLYAAENPLSTLRPGHPRLLVTGADAWADLAKLKTTDPRFALLAAQIGIDARALLKKSPEEYHKTGKRLLAVSRNVLKRTLLLAMAYRLDPNEAFLRRAEVELLAAAAFADWNSSHFLDTAEMTAALAIGYDWLYDGLSLDAREKIRHAIATKGLRPALEEKASFNSWQRNENNWNQVCFGGLTLGALAIAEDEPELSAKILLLAKAGIVHGLKPYVPDGVYPEGPGYWSYGTNYQVLMIAAMKSALGTDWGLPSSPGLCASAGAYLEMVGPSGLAFNYSDGTAATSLEPALFWFARQVNDPGLVRMERGFFETVSKGGKTGELGETNRFYPLSLLWWPSPGAFEASPSLPLCWQGRGANPIGVFRSSWTEPGALYLAFKGGSAGLSHAHMDAGTFVFEADGVRWAQDLGAQDYESLESKKIDLWNKKQDSQRWQVFRLNNFSHNTLTIDGQLHRVAGSAEFVAFSGNRASAFGVLDMSAVFAGQATAVKRGYRMLEGRSVLIQDEISGAKPGVSVRWAMVTGAEVVVNGPQATLRENGHELRVELLGATKTAFSVISADPPANGYDAPNPGRRILVATVPVGADGSVRIAVWLKPQSAGAQLAPELIELKDWAAGPNQVSSGK